MTAGERRSQAIAPLRGYQCLLFLLGAVLLWPWLLYHDPFVFYDTVSYLRGADTLFAKLTGHQHPFFAPPAISGATAAIPGATPADGAESGKLVLYGRSVYFGVFLYAGLVAGFWLTLATQAAAAGAVIVGLVRHFVDPARERAFLRACLVAFAVAACTPLPFIVCYLMPDLWVGIALPAAVILLWGWERERASWRLGFAALALFAALSHSTAVAAMLVLGALALMLALMLALRARGRMLPALLVLAIALGGVAGEAAFGLASRVVAGATPVRPPFLTARLIEDGPGRRFLTEHCAGTDFVLCRYPLSPDTTAETFLWAGTRPLGGFKALPQADALAVAAEQQRFALAVVRTYPRETLTALARNIGTLAVNLQLEEMRPQFVLREMRSDMSFGTIPTGPPPLANRIVSGLSAVLLLAAAAGLAWIAWGAPDGPERRAVLGVAAAIAINDVICACLSGPFARYNTRVIWALPLVVLLFVLSQRLRERE